MPLSLKFVTSRYFSRFKKKNCFDLTVFKQSDLQIAFKKCVQIH